VRVAASTREANPTPLWSILRKPIFLALTTCAVVAVASVGVTVSTPSTADAAAAQTLVSSPDLDSHVIFQDFSFFQPYESDTYETLTARAEELADLGITDVWMAPPYRALNAYNEEGYAVTDRYDLGEFPAGHNGETATKYGTAEQLKDAIKAMHNAGISVQADIVPNQIYLYQDREVVPVTAVNQYGNLGTEDVRGKLYEVYTVGGGEGQKKYGTFDTWTSAYLNGLQPQELGTDRVMLDADGRAYRYTGGDATAGSNYVPTGMGTAADINNIDGYLTVDGYHIAGKTASGGDIWRPNLMYYVEHQDGATTISYLDYVRANPPVGSGVTEADTDAEVRTKLIAATDSAVSNTTNDYIGSQPGYNATSEQGISALRFDNNDINDVNQNVLQYEFLLGPDVDNTNAAVRADTTNWLNFLYDEYDFDGFRWDAAGHYNKNVLTDAAVVAAEQVAASGETVNDNLSYIESYVEPQIQYLNDNGNAQLAYDSGPHYAYLNALAKLIPTQNLSDTITSSMVNRVDSTGTAIPNWSFVNNHDQETGILGMIPVTDLQTGGAPYGTKEYQLAAYKIYVADRKRVAKLYSPYNVPSSYAIALTNKDTVPTVFYGDMWESTDSYMKTETPYYDAISDLLTVRKANATGEQVVSNYASNLTATPGQHLISSVREGTDRETGLGVVVGNSPDLDTTIDVPMGADHANQEYVDAMGYHDETLTTDDEGMLTVAVKGTSNVQVNGYLAVWTPKTASAEPAPTQTPTPTETVTPAPEPTVEPMQPVTPVVPEVPAITPSTTRMIVANPTIKYGTTTTLAAAVDIGATGTITFKSGSTVLGAATIANGIATVTTSSTLSVKTRNVTATYSGDATHAASVSAVSKLKVTKAKTTTTVSKKTAVKGKKAKVLVKTSQLANGKYATGKVRIYVGKKVVKTVTLKAKNHGKINVLLPAKYSNKKFTVKAKYMGSTKVAAKTSKTLKITPTKR